MPNEYFTHAFYIDEVTRGIQFIHYLLMECCTDIGGLPLLFVIETYLGHCQVSLYCKGTLLSAQCIDFPQDWAQITNFS